MTGEMSGNLMYLFILEVSNECFVNKKTKSWFLLKLPDEFSNQGSGMFTFRV